MIAAALFMLNAESACAQLTPPIGSEKEVNTNRTTAGHSFTVPEGWSQSQRNAVVVLEAPDKGSSVAFVDVKAQNAEGAVEVAWLAYRGGERSELQSSLPLANRNGWQDGRNFVFNPPAGKARQLNIRVMRHGDRWAVTIEDLDDAVARNRAAELSRIREGFLPAGYVPENFTGRKAHKLDPVRIKALTDFVENSRRALEIPGIAIGIVQDGKTIFSGGFGVREMGRPERVDTDTLFLIASNTKPLTSLLLAKLVDEGKITWETPVIDILPQFKLADAEATQRIQVKHLLCACIGLPYRNLDWEFAAPNAPATLALDVLARMRPTGEFGKTYSYSNPILAAAGLVAGKVAFPEKELGAAFDEAMSHRVFRPLGMTRSTFDFNMAMQGNFARSYGRIPGGEIQSVDPARNRQVHAVRPVGGAWSNVNDLLAYVRMEIANGRLPNGKRYIGEAALKARAAPQVSSGTNLSYGLGLETNISSGTPVIFHGGRFYGFRGDTIWLPEHQVGFVVLMNSSSGNVLMDAFPRKVLELLFDGRPEAESMVAAAAAAEPFNFAASGRLLNFPVNPQHAAMLASRYKNEILGDLQVTRSGAELVFEFAALKTPMASAVNPNGAIRFVAMRQSPATSFLAGKSEGKRTLTIREGPTEFVFVEAE